MDFKEIIQDCGLSEILDSKQRKLRQMRIWLSRSTLVLGSLFGGWLAVKLMNLTRFGKSGYTGCFLIGAKLFKKSINNWPQNMRDKLIEMIENIFKEKRRFDFKFKSLKDVKKQMQDSISKNFHDLEKFSKKTFPS